jgi:hypothetical protein
MLNDTFERFGKLLQERFNTGVSTTEDSIRYTFFLALLDSNFCQHSEIVLEESHPAIPKAQIDLLIQAAPGRLSTAFEFKYDRAIPSGRNQPRTQKAGAVFKDLFRLARIPAKLAQERYFIYVTGSEMRGYFQNPRNRFAEFFDLGTNQRFTITNEFIASQAQTFRRLVKGTIIPCSLEGAYRQGLTKQHILRVFRVIV